MPFFQRLSSSQKQEKGYRCDSLNTVYPKQSGAELAELLFRYTCANVLCFKIERTQLPRPVLGWKKEKSSVISVSATTQRNIAAFALLKEKCRFPSQVCRLRGVMSRCVCCAAQTVSRLLELLIVIQLRVYIPGYSSDPRRFLDDMNQAAKNRSR